MASTSQWPTDCVPPTLDVFIQVLSIAKDTCGIQPAQVAFGSASIILTVIRVRLPLPRNEDELLTPASLGHYDQRPGSR
jgi:hypothetical protein